MSLTRKRNRNRFSLRYAFFMRFQTRRLMRIHEEGAQWGPERIRYMVIDFCTWFRWNYSLDIGIKPTNLGHPKWCKILSINSIDIQPKRWNVILRVWLSLPFLLCIKHLKIYSRNALRTCWWWHTKNLSRLNQGSRYVLRKGICPRILWPGDNNASVDMNTILKTVRGLDSQGIPSRSLT